MILSLLCSLLPRSQCYEIARAGNGKSETFKVENARHKIDNWSILQAQFVNFPEIASEREKESERFC